MGQKTVPVANEELNNNQNTMMNNNRKYLLDMNPARVDPMREHKS